MDKKKKSAEIINSKNNASNLKYNKTLNDLIYEKETAIDLNYKNKFNKNADFSRSSKRNDDLFNIEKRSPKYVNKYILYKEELQKNSYLKENLDDKIEFEMYL